MLGRRTSCLENEWVAFCMAPDCNNHVQKCKNVYICNQTIPVYILKYQRIQNAGFSIFLILNHGISTVLFFVKGIMSTTENRLGMLKKPGLYRAGIPGFMSSAISHVSSPGSGYTSQCVIV